MMLGSSTNTSIPVSIYTHIPWCVRKCPYCDFNSHRLGKRDDLDAYIDALLLDLNTQREWLYGREVTSIFIGGGTPSLLDGAQVTRLLEGINKHICLRSDAEITLEANPGTAEASHFTGYRASGINRLSLGFQSLDDRSLQAIGRIHDRQQALTAYAMARAAGFDNINIDLMFALPGHSSQDGLADLSNALLLEPEHLSWYQLTLEPNTPFAHAPPPLPDEDAIWQIQQEGEALLHKHGYRQYEVSAYARHDRTCRHNLNYWRFGDYLGIGAGAHGKITLPSGEILRYRKPRRPSSYMQTPSSHAEAQIIAPSDLPMEFMMNALRLKDGVESALFEQRTRCPLSQIREPLAKANKQGLLAPGEGRIQASANGYRFLNNLILLFDQK